VSTDATRQELGSGAAASPRDALPADADPGLFATLPSAPSLFQVGIDAAEVGRIARAVDRWGERFLRRVYTDAEQTYCGRRAQRLAGRFAAKEAVSKALGTGIRALRWRDIEVLPDPRGKPEVILHGKAAARARQIGVTWFSLSITHTGDLALVFVIAG
jgi:holo-[acyl-carrier protein] synthase